MPTLQFKGRNIIWNHHLTVPYHTLDEDATLSFDPAKGEGNIIVEGDNLTALKALLPQYAGKIKCIYIDPPYNTGKEEWVYSDKVNSPLIAQWLNNVVGKEDMTKHDKWLCMLVPRLKLLKELLKPEGIIFISLDNNEAFNFKAIADEIFGEENFLGVIIIQTATDNNPTQISTEHEYMFAYANSIEYQTEWEAKSYGAELIQNEYLRLKEIHSDDIFEIQKQLRIWIKENKKDLPQVTHYDNVDDKGVYHDADVANTKFGGYFYDVIHPVTKKPCKIPEKGFRFPETSMKELIKSNDIVFGADETTLIKPKKRVESVTAKLRSIIYEDGRAATKELEHLFHKDFFKNPKSPKILSSIFEYCTSEDDIILDSFAGSGTTGQAVLELNKEDGGNRKFILVQMTEASDAEPDKNIARDITAERIKRAITKYNLNSGFTYYKLGTAIDAETLLQGDLPTYEQFAKYVYYLCTGQHHSKPKEIKPKDYFVGNAGNTAIYLIYEQDFEKLTQLALNLSLAEKFRKASANKPVVVYAPACFLDEEYLQDFNMQFVSIPYNLFQKNEQP